MTIGGVFMLVLIFLAMLGLNLYLLCRLFPARKRRRIAVGRGATRRRR